MFSDRFMTNIRDSECAVHSWDAASRQLILRIEKDVGPESGKLTFDNVAFVHLPPCFTIYVAAASKNEVPDFPGVRPEPEDCLFVFQEAHGNAYYVIAESADYQIDV